MCTPLEYIHFSHESVNILNYSITLKSHYRYILTLANELKGTDITHQGVKYVCVKPINSKDITLK